METPVAFRNVVLSSLLECQTMDRNVKPSDSERNQIIRRRGSLGSQPTSLAEAYFVGLSKTFSAKRSSTSIDKAKFNVLVRVIEGFLLLTEGVATDSRYHSVGMTAARRSG
jgi:hypothetical protein